MATLIDSLVVSLSLDPSGFVKGSKEADASLKETADQAGRTGGELENRGKQAATFFSQIRDQVIGLFAAFTAGKGLTEFATQVTTANTAAGLLAKNVNVSVTELTAWQAIAKQSGASASDVDTSMTSLTQQFQQFALTGNSAVIPYFRALGISVADSSGKMRPMNDILLDLADRFKGMDPAKAQAFGAGLGLTPGMVNTLMQGRDALRALREEVDKQGHANKADTDAAKELTKAFGGLAAASTDLGTKLLTAATPGILAVVNALTRLAEWAKQHRTIVEAVAAVVAAVAGLATAFILVNSTIALFGMAASGAAAVLGLFAAPFAAIPALVGAVTTAFTALGIAISATPVGWILTGIAALGLAAYELYKHWDGIAEWWHNLWAGIRRDASKPEDTFTEEDKKKGDFKAAPNQPFNGFIKPDAKRAGTPGTLSGSDVDKLVALGWTRPQATGIVANLSRESGGNAQAVGDNGQAFGLAQWHPDRQAAFKAWAGHDIRGSSRDEQLGFIDYELRQGTERKAGAALAQTKDAGAAARTFSKLYERPAHGEEEATLRANLALGAAGSRLAAGAGSSASTSTSRTDVTIGTVNVNAPNATDSDGVAKGINKSIKRYGFLPAADSGLS